MQGNKTVDEATTRTIPKPEISEVDSRYSFVIKMTNLLQALKHRGEVWDETPNQLHRFRSKVLNIESQEEDSIFDLGLKLLNTLKALSMVNPEQQLGGCFISEIGGVSLHEVGIPLDIVDEQNPTNTNIISLVEVDALRQGEISRLIRLDATPEIQITLNTPYFTDPTILSDQPRPRISA